MRRLLHALALLPALALPASAGTYARAIGCNLLQSGLGSAGSGTLGYTVLAADGSVASVEGPGALTYDDVSKAFQQAPAPKEPAT